jgi:putative transcriptional regulator
MALSDQATIATGDLLIAPPMLTDPNFRRSVILLCEHGDSGSFGLILNRCVSVEMVEVVEDLASYREPIHIGGPVQTDTLHFLHRMPDLISDSRSILDDVHWGGDADMMLEAVASKGPDRNNLKFFLGYAGWTEGQLSAEVDAGGWIVVHGTPELVFYDDPRHLWQTVMRRLGGEYALFSNYPDDPRLN